jgi:SAM-dependent methyltransferase
MAGPRERFTDRAEAYVAGRPDYPEAALAALFTGAVAPADATVADLGAGTGISARALARLGARVFAIEPNAAMRSAAAPDPRVTWIDGTAEATTLPGGSVDLAVALQAWHWFDGAAAVAEARRILRPGGRLGLVANERDERDATTAAYGAIVRSFALEDVEARRARALAAFSALPGAVRAEFASAQALDRAGFFARAASTSYLPHAGPAAARLRDALTALFAERERNGTVTLQLTTTVAYARLK